MVTVAKDITLRSTILVSNEHNKLENLTPIVETNFAIDIFTYQAFYVTDKKPPSDPNGSSSTFIGLVLYLYMPKMIPSKLAAI